MKLIDFIITVFVLVDDFYKSNINPRQLRTRGFMPNLSDSEVITMEIVSEYLGFHTDKDIYNYFNRHWKHLFPNIPDRSNFVRQCANLWKIKELFFIHLTENADRFIQFVDSMPVEVCKFVRARNTKLFKDSAAYGKWWGETFFGYRAHFKISSIGMIKKCIIAPANIHDIHFAADLLSEDENCWVLGDKGYRSKKLQKELWEEKRIYFHTSLRRIDKKTSPLPKKTIHKLSGMRRLVETVCGQLEEHFSIKHTTARDFWHLVNRIFRKILSHTVCIFINLQLNREPLQIKGIVI